MGRTGESLCGPTVWAGRCRLTAPRGLRLTRHIAPPENTTLSLLCVWLRSSRIGILKLSGRLCGNKLALCLKCTTSDMHYTENLTDRVQKS